MMTYNGLAVPELWLELMLVMVLTMLLFLDHGPQVSSILRKPVMLVFLEYGSLELIEVHNSYCVAGGLKISRLSKFSFKFL